MSKATILLCPRDIMIEAPFLPERDAAKLIGDSLAQYTNAGTIETEYTGEDAAEEMFDLTNNPSRQEEREKLYGRGRSVSVGDVIEVDGNKWACLSFGWVWISG